MLQLVQSGMSAKTMAMIAAGVGALVALAAAYIFGRMDGANSVQVEFDAYRIANAKAIQMAHEQTREVERQANERITAQKEIDRENLDAIDRKHRASLDRLRQQLAAAGSASVPPSSESLAATCAEAVVADGDGRMVDWQFPIDFARDAEKLQIALESCVSQYDTMMEAINGKRGSGGQRQQD